MQKDDNVVKKVIIILSIIFIVLISILCGLVMYNKEEKVSINKNDVYENINNQMQEDNSMDYELSSIQTSFEEEKTTPNTLIVYKKYYTKCKHYITEYQNIDVSLVNLTRNEFKEKLKGWSIEKFESEEIEISKELEEFCNEHYMLKLENNVIVIYKIDELGIETEYEQTGITTEYLTNEDILKLKSGIYVYGKENLTNTIEDYE